MNYLQTLYIRFQTRNIKIKGKIINTNFSVISNNCWGAEIYRELEIQYLTPFVGLFIFATCYIELLKNLDLNMKKDLIFINKSKYESANTLREKQYYPIGLLGGNIEIHFLHYENDQEALEKWTRRTERINWNNLFIEFSDRDEFAENHLEEFDKLPYKQKVCFTSKNYPQYKSAVWIKDCKNDDTVVDGKELYDFCKKYFDIAKWLNSTN
jgi:uncharacterized protein (DUF1919 family)